MNAIHMFDVDWMRGTNVGLIKVNYSNVNDVLDDLNKMLASNQAEIETGGILTLDSIERLNSILVITRQYSYLKRVEKWVRKLDLPTQGVGKRLYIYSVKNSTAKDLAKALSELLANGDEEITSAEDNVTGPGSMPISLREPVAEEPQQDPADISKLDVPPLQVLIEVTIMDIQLTDNFSYGMQWFLQHGDANSGGSAIIGDALTLTVEMSGRYLAYWHPMAR